ncbi:MAG: hypothetical protein A2V70_07335 [Planctomycetes bacterium RBG_13_63_9]|nr:MAG: hypothetical protein A2V70_07335 [Planctomycetes bacterium RBG_13_63_9]
MRRLVLPLVVSVLLAGPAQAPAASFEVLAQFPAPGTDTYALAVSADGQVVVGAGMDGVERPFRWTAAEGMVGFTGNAGRAYDLSADGSVVVGFLRGGPSWLIEAFRWTQQEGVVILPMPPDWDDNTTATGVSAHGSIIVGKAGSYDDGRLFRWTESEGMVDLGRQGRSGPGSCPQISPDGSVIVGNDPERGAFRWTQETGRTYLGTLPDALGNPFAYNVSADGSAIVGTIPYGVGESGDAPFRWTEEEGIVVLAKADVGDAAGDEVFEGWATAVSRDGSVVVGMDTYYGPFIWDAEHGACDLAYMLEQQYDLEFGGFELVGVMDITADARVMVGYGYYEDPLGRPGSYQAWRVVVPEPSTTMLLITGLFAFLLYQRRNVLV